MWRIRGQSGGFLFPERRSFSGPKARPALRRRPGVSTPAYDPTEVTGSRSAKGKVGGAPRSGETEPVGPPEGRFPPLREGTAKRRDGVTRAVGTRAEAVGRSRRDSSGRPWERSASETYQRRAWRECEITSLVSRRCRAVQGALQAPEWPVLAAPAGASLSSLGEIHTDGVAPSWNFLKRNLEKKSCTLDAVPGSAGCVPGSAGNPGFLYREVRTPVPGSAVDILSSQHGYPRPYEPEAVPGSAGLWNRRFLSPDVGRRPSPFMGAIQSPSALASAFRSGHTIFNAAIASLNRVRIRL